MRCPLPAIYKLILPFAVCLAIGRLSAQTNGGTVKLDCAAVLNQMRADISKDPGRLVLAVEDALTTSEVCACPIIRTAVDLAGRDPALTSQVLIAAIRILPASAAQLTECVLLEAPEAAPEIRAALSKELGEKALGLLSTGAAHPDRETLSVGDPGKSPAGKEPVAVVSPEPAPEPDDMDLYPNVGVSGIYVIPTLWAGSKPGIKGLFPTRTVVRTIVTSLKKTPGRPVSPVTVSAPQ